MNLTFAALYTPEGVVIAAGVITSFVALLKNVFPVIDAKVSGALMAFVVSALLYLASLTAVPILAPDNVLALLMAWLACATAAVGINSTVKHVTGSTS
jgi:Mg2+/Co2+ transporter CorB